MIAEVVATLSAGLFSGAAIYINLVEHPARVSCGTASAVSEFGPSYKRAAVMQASLAVVGLVSSLYVWWLGGGAGWLVGGVLLGSVVPFTLVAIMPTNKRLLSSSLDRNSAEAESLLRTWNRLHAVRSVLGTVGFMSLLVELAG
jgi:hypothetical protein